MERLSARRGSRVPSALVACANVERRLGPKSPSPTIRGVCTTTMVTHVVGPGRHRGDEDESELLATTTDPRSTSRAPAGRSSVVMPATSTGSSATPPEPPRRPPVHLPTRPLTPRRRPPPSCGTPGRPPSRGRPPPLPRRRSRGDPGIDRAHPSRGSRLVRPDSVALGPVLEVRELAQRHHGVDQREQQRHEPPGRARRRGVDSHHKARAVALRRHPVLPRRPGPRPEEGNVLRPPRDLPPRLQVPEVADRRRVADARWRDPTDDVSRRRAPPVVETLVAVPPAPRPICASQGQTASGDAAIEIARVIRIRTPGTPSNQSSPVPADAISVGVAPQRAPRRVHTTTAARRPSATPVMAPIQRTSTRTVPARPEADPEPPRDLAVGVGAVSSGAPLRTSRDRPT